MDDNWACGAVVAGIGAPVGPQSVPAARPASSSGRGSEDEGGHRCSVLRRNGRSRARHHLIVAMNYTNSCGAGVVSIDASAGSLSALVASQWGGWNGRQWKGEYECSVLRQT